MTSTTKGRTRVYLIDENQPLMLSGTKDDVAVGFITGYGEQGDGITQIAIPVWRIHHLESVGPHDVVQ